MDLDEAIARARYESLQKIAREVLDCLKTNDIATSDFLAALAVVLGDRPDAEQEFVRKCVGALDSAALWAFQMEQEAESSQVDEVAEP